MDNLQRGQRAFRRELARDEAETAKRLAAAYADFLKTIEDYLVEVESDADGASFTRDLRTLGSIERLQDKLRFSLDDLARLIERESRKLEISGIITSQNWTPSIFRMVGITGSFNQPTVQSIKAVVNYVDSAPFQARLNRYADYHAGQVSNIILSDASLGKSPIATARHIRRWVKTMPATDAYRMTRTVQVWAARAGTREIYRANRDIVLGWWWSSALDGRTCMSCLALHGQKFSVDDTLGDHHNGRCAAVPITGLTADRPIQTGEQWFNSLSEKEQIALMGRGKWEAWKGGEFGFADLTTRYQDPVYGTMYTAASLKDIRANTFDRGIRPEAYRPVPIEIRPEEKLPIQRARLIPPDRLEQEDTDDPIVAALWELAEYDDRANVLYNKLAIDNKYSDMLYELYKIGRNDPTPQDVESARLTAGVVLAAYEHVGVKLTAKQQRLLQGLAFGDVEAAIDSVKDNRMKTRVRTGGYKGGSDFVGAGEADAIARLRENRRGNASY